MMTVENNNSKGFFFEPEEGIEKSDYYLFHRDDGEKVHDKVISCNDLMCWCKKEFESLADFAEEELLDGHKVVTDQGVVSVEAAKGVEGVDPELSTEDIDN